jgi:hypothetical protein
MPEASWIGMGTTERRNGLARGFLGPTAVVGEQVVGALFQLNGFIPAKV